MAPLLVLQERYRLNKLDCNLNSLLFEQEMTKIYNFNFAYETCCLYAFNNPSTEGFKILTQFCLKNEHEKLFTILMCKGGLPYTVNPCNTALHGYLCLSS